MSDPVDTSEGSDPLESHLEEMDSDLTIFALANGLDLERNVSGVDRVFGWYRDRMERFVRVEGSDGTFHVIAEAVRTKDGVRRRARREVKRAIPPDELPGLLRGLLNEGMEHANDLGEGDLGAPD